MVLTLGPAFSLSSLLSWLAEPRTCTTTMAETDDSTTATTNPPHQISFPDLDHTLSLTFEELMKDVPCNFVEAADYLDQTASTFDSDWGFVYTNQGPSGALKNGGGGGSRYSSSDCWSAVSETLNSSWRNNNNSGIDSNQDASGSATPKLISIASFSSCIEVGCGEEDKRKGKLKRKKSVGDKESEIFFEHNSSCDIHSLATESDGEEIASSESSGDEMLSKPSVYVNEEKQEVKFQVPEIGLVFSSEEEAYKFYKNYAGGIGFSVRKGKVQRISNGAIRKRYFFCSRQGFRLKKQHEKKTKYKRKETRTGCEAKVQFTVENGKWKISLVILEHNHAIESPRGKTGSCTKISEADSIIPIISEAEAGTVSEAENGNHMGFHNMYCSNYLRDKKINLLQPEDSQSLLNYLKRLQVEDPLLFYSVQVDAENRVTNFFWRDGRSKIDYDYFGDIIILDTAFRMSIYDMICIPFWGLNHHQQYILFGCAFMLDESIDSLIWLLGTFLEAMGTRQPKTILTDESKAMEKAIEAVLPKTQHCLCTRYICQNARKHLSAYFGEPDFESLFNKCIFDCQSEEELESTWESLLEQHNLHENSWLNTIYMLRYKWSPVFCKKTFCAGVQSNHGSETENINNVFQNVASEIMTLPKFVQQYERAAQQRRREELYEDFRCKGSASWLTLRNSAMEKQAANMYTHTMFKIFQGELLGCLSVAIEEISSDGSMVATFKLTEEGDEKENLVEFNCVDSKVTCSCGKFESIGVLCFHALKVLNARNIFHIPPQYLLKRWTKYANEGFVEDDHGAERHDKSYRPLTLWASKLIHKALNVITKSVAFEKSRKMTEGYLDTALKSVEYLLKTKNIEHLEKNDFEVDWGDNAGDANGIGSMGTQKVIRNSPCVDLKEESSQGMGNQIEKICNDDAGGTARNSFYDAISHSQPPQEITQGSGGLGFSHPSYFTRDLASAEQQQPVQYWSDDALNLSGRRRKMMVNRLGKDGRSISRPPLPTNTTKLYRGVRQGHWGKWGGETLLPQHRTRL